MKRLLLLCILCLGLAPPLLSQPQPAQLNGTITGTGCISVPVSNRSTIAFQVTGGTWTGTIQPQGIIQGGTAFNLQVTPVASTTAQNTVTANGAYSTGVAGLDTFQLCGNTVTNTATVAGNAVAARNSSAGGGGGGGSGTVTSVNGTANQITSDGSTTTPTLSIPSTFTFPGTVTNNLSIFGATTSAQMRGIISDESGTGVAIFGTSPTLVTPALGTPSALVLTNATGLSGHTASTALNCLAASASGTAYTCSTSPTFTPADGDAVLFEADVANTGAATLNVNASSAAPLRKQGGGTALAANDLLAGQDTLLVYDGSNWQMQGQLGNVAAGANTALSNLASVAINTAPLPNADNTLALGSASFRWSNAFLGAGTSAAPAVALGGAVDGFYQFGAHQVGFSSNNFVAGNFNGSDGFDLNAADFLGWCASGGACTGGDLALSRMGANVARIGSTSTPESGFLRGANTCRINANITLSTSATTICTWTIPTITAGTVWAWNCNFDYNVSAGTVPTITINMNSVTQAPTTETGSATIYTTTGLVGTQNTVTSTSSGAVAILTSASITPGATIDQAQTFGTVQLPGSANTFLISITGAGTGFAGTLNAGSSCILQ